jgi:hypothetical protein
MQRGNEQYTQGRRSDCVLKQSLLAAPGDGLDVAQNCHLGASAAIHVAGVASLFSFPRAKVKNLLRTFANFLALMVVSVINPRKSNGSLHPAA